MPKSWCKIKERTRLKYHRKIDSLLLRNGFPEQKMSDLCQYIGIAQGSILQLLNQKGGIIWGNT